MQTKFEKQVKAAQYCEGRIEHYDKIIADRQKLLAEKPDDKSIKGAIRQAESKKQAVTFDLKNLNKKLGR